jgi:hypothetical protein
MIWMIVRVDYVFRLEVLISDYFHYGVCVEAWVDYSSFFRGFVCKDVREVVSHVLDLLEEH